MFKISVTPHTNLMLVQKFSVRNDLGTVVKVEDFGAAPLLVVRNESKEFLIPLTREICPDVDTGNKKIVVNPPNGLLDL